MTLELVLRKAIKEDCIMVFELSNDSEVRLNSINTDEITLEEHEKWFAKKNEDPNYILLLAFRENQLIGQVKFELAANVAVISISISTEFRGKGLGPKLIREGVEFLQKTDTKIREIIAYIKPENLASIKSFLRAGFKEQGKTIIKNNEFMQFKLSLIYEDR